ncbi:MAG: AAA family ATPase [Anaerolineales bacterium]|nr:AAA family ATPase [Anaerolineales bacterium]
MPSLKLALLGPPIIEIDGKAVKTDRRKAIALLAYLACAARPQTREHLATLLWPEYDRDSAYAYLRRTLWEINQMLGKGWLSQEREYVTLEATARLWLDTAQFEALKQSKSSAMEVLTETVSLYRGDFMEGFIVADTAPFEDWQTRQAEYYRREYATALQKLIQAHRQRNEPEAALQYARRWLSLDELNETAHTVMMSLLAEMGDRAGAVRQYEACVKVLKNELGVQPQPDSLRLYEAILSGKLDKQPSYPNLMAQAGQPHPAQRLPELPTPFIGRREEVEQIKALVRDPSQRLITLIGPGGTGKTRLSIQVAEEVSGGFMDGVHFASLATVPSQEAVISTLANLFGFTFYREEAPRQQLLDYLRARQLLIVLDNFEHLLPAANLVVEILANAPQVKLLVTSRVRLNVQGEQLVPVGGMHSPGVDQAAAWQDPVSQALSFSAVQLFLERARRVQPSFELTQTNLKAVLDICRLVEGMPLGLELAAAWLELLQPNEIAEEITRSLDILETNQAGVPERQRSIRAVFESSWKLLSEPEQTALKRLCVFRGSFSRDAAQQVSGASLRILLGLVEKSWLQHAGGGRFQLHELLRHYGYEQLQMVAEECRAAHERHSAYFTHFTNEQNRRMRSEQQLAGKQAFEEELNANIQVAWDWLIAQRRWPEILDPFAIGLIQVGILREQMSDFIPWLRHARLVLTSEPVTGCSLACAVISTLEIFCEENEYILEHHPLERMKATWQMVHENQLAEDMDLWFAVLAFMVHNRNLDPHAQAELEMTVARLREENDLWKLGIGLYLQAICGGMYAMDREKLLEAGEAFRKLGVLHEQGLVAELLGSQAIHQKQPLYVILEYYHQAKHFFTQMGDESRATLNFLDLSGLFFRIGLVEEGFDIYQETERALEKVGNLRRLAISLHWQSLHAARYSTFDHAWRTRQRQLELLQKENNQADFYLGLYEAGEIYRIFGDLQKARAFYEQAYPGFVQRNMLLSLGYYERAYGDLAFEAADHAEALRRYEKYAYFARQENHPWSMAQARARCALAKACLGKIQPARCELHELIAEIKTWGEDELILAALLAEPVCLVQEGKAEPAVELAAFICHHPVAWREMKQQARTMLEHAAQGLPEEAVQAAIRRGEAKKLDDFIQTVLSWTPDGDPTASADLPES